MQREYFKLFSELLEYPQNGYHEKLVNCSSLVSVNNSLSTYLKFAKEKSLHELQELYVRTFELSPVCNLYVGVHIFGEDGFKRGSFMSRLKKALEEHEVETNDVPDFLPNILKLASKLEGKEKYNDLINECIRGPLDLMLDSFKEKSNPYKSLLIAIKDFANSVYVKEGIQHA